MMIPLNSLLVLLFTNLTRIKDSTLEHILKSEERSKEMLADYRKLNNVESKAQSKAEDRKQIITIFQSLEDSSKVNVSFKFSNIIGRFWLKLQGFVNRFCSKEFWSYVWAHYVESLFYLIFEKFR